MTERRLDINRIFKQNIHLNIYKDTKKAAYRKIPFLPFPSPVTEFKEFERRFKYGWFHLKLYQMFQDLSRR